MVGRCVGTSWLGVTYRYNVGDCRKDTTQGFRMHPCELCTAIMEKNYTLPPIVPGFLREQEHLGSQLQLCHVCEVSV